MLKKRIATRIAAIMMTSVMAVSFVPEIAFGAEADNNEVMNDEIASEELIEEDASGDIEGVPQVDGQIVEASADPAELSEMTNEAAVTEDQANRLIVLTNEDIENSEGAQNAFYNENEEAFVLEYDSEEATENAKAELSEQFGEGNVIQDVPMQLDSTSWGTDTMGLNTLKATANKSSLKSSTVAVIDTGINRSHTQFKGRIHSASRGFGASSCNDIHGHGSNVAGIIADGTSSQVKIMALRVMNDYGGISLYEVVNAVNYAVNKGASVINMSLGVNVAIDADTKAYMEAALKRARDKGVVVIASAGNDNRNVSTNYPASSKYTIAVSAIDKNKKKASFSNYGAGVDFCAPGVSLKGAARTGSNSYSVMSGTSQAAPSLTAAAAMVKLYHPSYSYNNVYQVLKEQAVDLGAKGKDSSFGYGYVNIKTAQETRLGGPKTVSINSKVTVAKTTVRKLASGKKSFTVQWTKKSVSGYQVRYATNKSMKAAKTKTITKNSVTKLTVKNLPSKKYHYVQVRCFKKSGGKTTYSGWTTVKAVKTK